MYDRLVNPNPLDKPVIEPVNIEKPVFKQPVSIEPDKESVQEQAAFKEKPAVEENTELEMNTVCFQLQQTMKWKN